MRQELSSPRAWVYRWLLPALLTVAALVAIWSLAIARQPGVVETLAVVAAAGALLSVARVFDRAKRVWLCEGKLTVSDLRREVDIDLANVGWLATTPVIRPTRICIRLVRPTAFGDTLYFFPPVGEAPKVLHDLDTAQREARRPGRTHTK